MKNSYSFSSEINKKYTKVINYDRSEIDNPILNHPSKINYMDRINTVISIISKIYNPNIKINIAEIGCAQANMSLLLAEKGYSTIAIDIDNYFIEYSKLKYQKGNISWFNKSIENTGLSENSLDVIILGELVEHMAYPEKIINNIKRYLKKDGIIIITTPNGQRIKNNLPRFSEFSNEKKRKELEKKQFGPDGSDHLFLFSLKELNYLVPLDMKIIKKGYCGGSILYLLFFKFFGVFLKSGKGIITKFLTRLFSMFPVINKFFYNNIYITISYK